jgi:tetratricopeptide (TPR) repeat protein
MKKFLSRMIDRIFGYDFFLSYSHADGKNYPKHLKARLEQTGFKVFLDQTEFVPGFDLRRETRRHVEKSQKLVVIGRDHALKSVWVKREVDVIINRGRTPILININKSLEHAPAEAELAAMAREQHWLRLEETIDESDGVPTDHALSELVRSFGALRQETKRQRILLATAAVFAVMAMASGYLAWLSEQRRQVADERLTTTLETATQFVNRTVQMSDRYGVPRELVLELLKEPEQVFLKLSQAGTDTPEVRQRRAQTLLDFSDNYELLGDSTLRLTRAREAKVILADLVKQSPEKLDWQLRLAAACSKVGTALLFRGDKAGADAEYKESLRIRKALADTFPAERKVQRDYSVALNRMGEVLIEIGQYEEAREYLKQARDLQRRLLSAATHDKELKRNIFVTQIRMGDSFKAEQKFDEARAEYIVSRDISEDLTKDETSKNAARDFTVSLMKIGETYLGDDNAADARPFYERALPIREKLANTDASNHGAQRDLFVNYIQLGHVAYIEKRAEPARLYFGKALAISEKLAQKDPHYGQWEIDAIEARGWFGMAKGAEGQEMIRDAIASLETLRSNGRLPADRQVLISQFKGFIDERAARR